MEGFCFCAFIPIKESSLDAADQRYIEEKNFSLALKTYDIGVDFVAELSTTNLTIQKL